MKRAVSASITTLMSCLAAAVSTGANAQAAVVEQVVVTARKRSESATAVPMSLNVVSAATIEGLQVRNLADLSSLAHNVAMFEDFPGAGIPTWVIRGVGLQDFNSNNSPAAAVYADGVYQTSTVMGILPCSMWSRWRYSKVRRVAYMAAIPPVALY